MIFKHRKIPKHLIIQEEYEIGKRSKINLLKLTFWCLLLVSLIYVLIK